MAVMDGCEGSTKTWVLEEKECPECGQPLEYYTSRGRIVEDVTCSCGYVLKAQERVPFPNEKKE
jgi:transcription initiation factor IIE alpha subunit